MMRPIQLGQIHQYHQVMLAIIILSIPILILKASSSHLSLHYRPHSPHLSPIIPILNQKTPIRPLLMIYYHLGHM